MILFTCVEKVVQEKGWQYESSSLARYMAHFPAMWSILTRIIFGVNLLLLLIEVVFYPCKYNYNFC